MEEKELNALLEKVDERVKSGVKAEMKTALDGIAKTSDLEARFKEMGLEKQTITELLDAVKAQGDKINALAVKSERKVKTIPEILAENREKIQSLKEDRGRKVTFFVNKTNVTTGSITSDNETYHIPDFADTGIAPATLEAAWRLTGNVQDIPANSHGVISYTDLTTRTNNAAMTNEATVYPENAYAWTGYTKTIEKAITSIPVTWEALNDIPQMEATIRRLITADLLDVVETQLATGTGTAPQVQGVYTAAQTASTAGTTITNSDPTIYDLAMWMKRYIVENYGSKFMPNVVLMNNGDALKAKWVKDADGQYVRNPFLSPDGARLDGMLVVETPKITANTMLVGDMRFANLYISNGVEIEVGLDGNDFTYDLYTVKARRRLCVVIRTPDTYALLKSTDIDTDIANIQTAGE